MKYTFPILSATAAVLFLININSLVTIAKPLTPEPTKPVHSTNYDLNKCPATDYTSKIVMDLEYKHCTTCDHGVFLEHDDAVKKCTYCGVKETYKR